MDPKILSIAYYWENQICTSSFRKLTFAFRFPSNPLTIRVPFFLLFSFNKETPRQKGELLGYLGFWG